MYHDENDNFMKLKKKRQSYSFSTVLFWLLLFAMVICLQNAQNSNNVTNEQIILWKSHKFTTENNKSRFLFP